MDQGGFTLDPGIKIVLYCVGGAILASIIIGLLVGRYLRKRKEPDYHPVLSKKESIICGSSVLIGVIVIVAGLLLPKLFVKEMDVTDLSGDASDFLSSDGEVVSDKGDGSVISSSGGSVVNSGSGVAVSGGGAVSNVVVMR